MAFTVGVGSAAANSGSGTTVAVTLTGTTAGRHVIIGLGWESASTALSSLVCSGETVTLVGTRSTGGGMSTQFAYVAELATGGDKTFTATFASTVNGKGIFAIEVLGGDTASLLDTSTNATGTSTNPSTTHVTGADNCLVFGIEMNTTGAPTAGTGYTAVSGTGSWNKFFKAEYKLDAGTAGSKTVDWSNASSDTWVISAASFKIVDTTRDGSVNITEAGDTVSAAGNVAVSGSLSKTEGADVVDADGFVGTPPAVGTLTKTEANDTLSGAGNVPVNGSFTKTDANDTLGFYGTVANTGTLTATLPLFTLSASSGDGADITLPLFTLESAGLTGFVGSSTSSLPMFALEASGTNENLGVLEGSLPLLTLFAGDGGGLIGSIPFFTLDASGEAGVVAALDAALPLLTLDASGTFENVGTLAASLLALQASATGVHGTIGTADISVLSLTLLASGETGELATAALSLPLFTLSASGYPPSIGTASIVLPLVYLSASGVTPVASGARTWVVNLRTNAVTEYTGFTFNSYANFDGRVLAANDTGVFQLDSSTADVTTNIDAVVRTGKHSYDVSYLKRVPRLYVSYAAPSGGDFEVRTVTSEDGRRRYLLKDNGMTGVQQRRVPVGRGPKTKFWQFEFANREGADFELDGFIAYPEILGVRFQ